MEEAFNENFVEHLSRFIGRTVTIFTTSGGLSGQGFTGVVLSVNNSFVRLITRIGPAPGCSLGSACSRRFRGDNGSDNDFDFNNGSDRFNRFNVGSVTDIPIDRIASFVHDAI